ncbi:MAG TPA: hypothetical protein VED01_25335 [Burkholderiales bacterium]|nr:hypothetical protein [Burkholderiales bacterium]
MTLTAVAVALALASLTVFDEDQRTVAVPLYLIVSIVSLFLAFLTQRDGKFPYFDIGVFCALVTGFYLAYPLLAYLISGLTWSEMSDNRLLVYNATPAQFARVAWWGVVYLLFLCTSYALVRRYPAARAGEGLEEPSRTAVAGMIALVAFTALYTQLVQIVFQVDLNPSYEANARTAQQLPLLLQQVTTRLFAIATVLQFALILLLVNHWSDVFWRYVLITWAALQAIMVILVFGARSSIVFFVVAWVLAHQRLRSQLHPLTVFAAGIALIAAAMLYGLVRDIGNHPVDSIFAASSEFQALYATAYDLIRLRETGMLVSVPWQMYIADLLRLIPQQLLPFDKIDPADWYLDAIGAKGLGVGLMFGVMGEAAIGLGPVELVLRGTAVGVIFGLIHNWYSARAWRFWPTVFYLWLTVWSYYTYRASTFYLLGHVVTIFLPAYLLVRIVESTRRSERRPARHGVP